MNFIVDKGDNTVSIGLSEIGSYFRFSYPLSVVWNDNRGSIGKYFCLLPYNEQFRNELKNLLIENLSKDFSENISELLPLLQPLFQLFKNGNYDLNFHSNSKGEMFEVRSFSGNNQTTFYAQTQVVFAEVTNKTKEEEIKNGHQKTLIESKQTKQSYVSNILEYSTYNLYKGDSAPFYATQPISEINQDQVEHYVKRITNGERPFAIIISATCSGMDYHSDYFILDGHHKLLAYQRLGIYPPIATITHLPSKEELDFNVEELINILYPWQIKHILENWNLHEKETFLKEKLENPESPLHKFIKNGYIEEYHENGKLKHTAFYINDKVDGISQRWFDNSRLEYKHLYKNGLRTGTWKQYYSSGKIEFVQNFDEYSNYDGLLISYYENGLKRWQQVLSNGRNVDGYSYKCWFPNGTKEALLKYKDGKMIERKNWNAWHQLVNHEVYNQETEKLEKKQTYYTNTPPETWFDMITTPARLRSYLIALLFLIFIVEAIRKIYFRPS